jgi:glyoxylase-like metal-dependent hydrolase (beta-lactamase superfamily II)
MALLKRLRREPQSGNALSVVSLTRLGHRCRMERMIPLEDTYVDVLEKAAAGLGFGKMALAERTGLSVDQIKRLMDGRFDPGDGLTVAEALGLHGPSLAALAAGAMAAPPAATDGLHLYNTPFPTPGYPEMTVNSYLIHHPESSEAVVFDTGTRVEDLLDDVRRLGLRVALVLLTHSHGDHVAALDALLAATGNPPVWLNARERLSGAQPFDAGRVFEAGRLRIETRLTSGHSPGGTSFVIDGLAEPLAVVGDALFRCSQGGARIDYSIALRHNRALLRELPDATLLCPGHGPLTTVGHEKAYNPFFPELKPSGA